MPEFDKHEEATFSWADLQTTDVVAARDFYTQLFGWSVEELPAGEGQTYQMFFKDGREVAGAGDQPMQQREAGVPPAWNAYFTVYDLDQSVKSVESAGGTVHAPPFDVMDAGRMAVIADPTGAFFCLWEPKSSIGARRLGDPGSLVWAECISPDVDAARAFYSELFGWQAEDSDMGEGRMYTVFKKGDASIAGLMAPQMQGMPAVWLVYFAVDDCDASVASATGGGGSVMTGPLDIPDVGRFAVLADPQGAVFAILTPVPVPG